MTTKGAKPNAKSKPRSQPSPETADEFDSQFPPEFSGLPDQLVTNFGPIIRLALAGGGYFGISVSDDRNSCKLAVRCGQFIFERRLNGIKQLEAASAFCFGKLRERVSVRTE